MALQNIRSNTASKRPLASGLSDGQIAVNTNETSPGLFFKGADGAVLKVGPVHIGNSAPNSSPATGGSTGNSVGEQWLDTSNSGFVFKIWDGTDWRSETGQFVDVTGDTMTGNLTISGADLVMDNGKIIAASGAEATPSITFDGDLDTGFHKPAADKLAISTGGTSRVFIDDSGNVGIGTNNPATVLHVAATAPRIRIEDSDATGTPYSEIRGDSGNLFYNANQNAALGGDHIWSSGGASNELMRIDSSGNVGIGTSSPGAKLEVSNGDALIYGLTVGRGAGALGSNTAVGSSALNANTTGINNTAIGLNALQNNTTGINNTAVGRTALFSNTTGNDNTANGVNALYFNTTGGANTAAGVSALFNNTTGTNNTAIGRLALQSNTTGGSNTANGASALSSNTTGIENTANGVSALFNNTTGSNNTAIGRSALLNNTTASSNTATGRNALFNNTTGNSNTATGRSALFSNTTGSGNIGIGFLNSAGSYAPVFNPTTENNRLVLGHTAITNAYVQVSWTVVSDERDKMNFAPVPYGLDFVNQLQPTAYQFKVDRDTEEPHGDVRYGFKAQDILALEGDNPVIIDTEDPERLKYKGEHLVPVLVNAVQELTTMVKDLQAEIAALKSA